MKRQIFTFLLIFISNLVNAQDDKNWGDWQTTKCFKGIQFRTRSMGTEPGKFGYSRYIQFRNNYNTKVAFGYTVKGFQKEHDEYVQIHGSQYRTELKANSTDDGLMWFSSTNANGQYISLGYLRFLGADETDASKTYEGCDDRTALLCNSCSYKPTYWCSNFDKSKDKKPEPVKTFTKSSTLKIEIINEIIENMKMNVWFGPRFTGMQGFNNDYANINFNIENSNIKVSLSYNNDSRIIEDFFLIPFESLNKINLTKTNIDDSDLWIENNGTFKRKGAVYFNSQLYYHYKYKSQNSFIDLKRLINKLQPYINQTSGENLTQPINNKVDEAKTKEQEMQNNAGKLDKEMKNIGNYLSQLPKEERKVLIDNANDVLIAGMNKQNAINRLSNLMKELEVRNEQDMLYEIANLNNILSHISPSDGKWFIEKANEISNSSFNKQEKLIKFKDLSKSLNSFYNSIKMMNSNTSIDQWKSKWIRRFTDENFKGVFEIYSKNEKDSQEEKNKYKDRDIPNQYEMYILSTSRDMETVLSILKKYGAEIISYKPDRVFLTVYINNYKR